LDAVSEKVNKSSGTISQEDLQRISNEIEGIKTAISTLSLSIPQATLDDLNKKQDANSRDLKDLIAAVKKASWEADASNSHSSCSLNAEDINEIRLQGLKCDAILKKIEAINKPGDETSTPCHEEISNIPSAVVAEIGQSITDPIQNNLKLIENMISPLQAEISDSQKNLNEVTVKLQNISQISNQVEDLKKDTGSIQNQLDSMNNQIQANNSAFEMYQNKNKSQLQEMNAVVNDHIQSFNNLSILFIVGLIGVIVLLFMTLFVILR
jgi:chromosome segregation ATPase